VALLYSSFFRTCCAITWPDVRLLCRHFGFLYVVFVRKLVADLLWTGCRKNGVSLKGSKKSDLEVPHRRVYFLTRL